jgi:plasmid maintenance system antidote protein VapI
VSLAAAVVDEVRRHLTAVGMSQSALARVAGIPPTLVHRTMRGDRGLTLDELEHIARALGTTPELIIALASGRRRAPPMG